MCLAIPSRIVEINDTVAIVDIDGVQREASIMLLEDVQVDDYVIVHAGFAISKLDEETARQTLSDMREMVEMSRKDTPDSPDAPDPEGR